MNIIVDKPQLVRAVLLYLNMNFGKLIPTKDKEDPDIVRYINSNNELMIEYYEKSESIYIHYIRIWSKLESLFYLSDYDIESIIRVWLEKDYKLGNLRRILIY
jgi:hypothetical protein